MEGLVFLAASNTFRNIFQDYPTNLFIIEPAEIPQNVQPDYFAKAFVINVFPFPGGP